jgi:ATP-binding cassette subfamily B protein/subfamily B ATP-binding cassette protein MsbA
MIAMARCHRRFIGIAALSSGIQAFSEAVSLGLIFMALELLGPNKDPGDSISRFTHLPSIVQPWMEGQSSNTLLAITLVLVLIVQGVQAASRYANGVAVELFAAACKAKVTNIVHKRLLGLSYASTQKIRTGGLITITTDGPEAVRQKIEEFAGLAVALLLICAYIVVLVRISAWMLFLAIGLAGLVLFVQMVPLKRIRRYSTKASEQQALINSSLADDVRAIKLLQATGNLSYPHRRMAKMAGKLEQDLRRRAFVSQLSQPITQFLGVIAIALVIGGGAFILADRQTSVIASLATFVIALQRLSGKLIQIGQISSTLASNEGRLAQLDDFLSDRDNQMRREKGSILTRRSTPAKVEFIHVGFTYPGNKQPTLHQLNLTIKAGDIIGLVGSSGSGKTTTIDLLCELIAPSCGRILIDDTDLHTINPLSWQQQIGLVTQEPYVFYGTIAENLYMNGAMIDRSRALKCLEQVNLDELIKALPSGLDTFIGEGGQQLSGGQKQRLTIARALYCDARLLIFDEATSSLDMENEMVISELLNQLRGKVSILLVAHRLQSIQHANCIHVMEQGRIIESGSHAELIKENRRYARLWNLQAGE